MTSIGRGSRRFQQLREELRMQRRPCWLCGQPIDYTATYPAPDSFVVDHKQSWIAHPELREDPANLAASHSRCNNAKGAGPTPIGLGVISEQW